MTESTLSGKIALVTGGGRGIGAAIAHALAGLGPTVVICGRTLPALQETAGKVRAIGGQCEAMACDVTDWNSVAALAARVEQTFGRLDILVNNAGIGSFDAPLHLMPPATWDAIFDTNLRGVFYMMRAFVPLMLESSGSDIINISSIVSKNALANGAAYAASKWGLNGLSYSVAEELRGKNIRVSVVCPGSVHTEFSPHTGKDATKMLQAEDVAHAVKMLVTQAPRAFASEVVLRPTQKP
ncbi:MAG TPA: SDR family NAD(P)-dependent oxidoreductase [Candidatus Angelobacter sp.]|nr:SDR family NAD(P)-dependent oxidoreductase [Candidatus Angelobacter sp.]